VVLGERTLVVGILNVTPDSFSDGGRLGGLEAAVARGLALFEEGADWVDVGGESTRPGAGRVALEEEIRRTAPVVEALRRRGAGPLSIDTTKAPVANFALDEGVSLVNDVSALAYDAEMGPLVASRGIPIVLMHMRGRPDDMYAHARYQDVTSEVGRELQRAVERAIGYGIHWDRILLDPGIGFAKRAEHSLALLAHGERLAGLGRPLLVGPSRKSFLNAATGPLDVTERDWPSAAAVTAAVLGGAHIVRVHRVREMVQVVRVAEAIRSAAA
jgi:dihydropteroate synthase